jgi:hypothetical protein
VIERITQAAAVPTTALAVVAELFRDWNSPLADKPREVINWYFADVPAVFQIYLPVRTHHVSCLLNGLARCQLH